MKTCPQCRLMLEPIMWEGAQVHACRSCGGCWFDAPVFGQVMQTSRHRLAQINALFPGQASAGTYEGLPQPCPNCGTTLLERGPLPQAPEQNAPACPKCRGVWLDAKERSALAGEAPAAPAVPETPAPPPETARPPAPEPPALPEPAPPEPDDAIPVPPAPPVFAEPVEASLPEPPLPIPPEPETPLMPEPPTAVAPVLATPPPAVPAALVPPTPEYPEPETPPIYARPPEPPSLLPPPPTAPPTPPAQEEQAAVLAELVASGESILCPRCLKVYDRSESECDDCRVQLVEPDFKLNCPQCQAVNSFINQQCRRCGLVLRSPEMLEELYPAHPPIVIDDDRIVHVLTEPQEVVSTLPPERPAHAPMPATGVAEPQRWCPQCRRGYPGTVSFCNYCGVGLALPTFRVRCLQCRSENTIAAPRCWSCGADMHPAADGFAPPAYTPILSRQAKMPEGCSTQVIMVCIGLWIVFCVLWSLTGP